MAMFMLAGSESAFSIQYSVFRSREPEARTETDLMKELLTVRAAPGFLCSEEIGFG
jgi:hypothetical protein